jgi:hypothetical protein
MIDLRHIFSRRRPRGRLDVKFQLLGLVAPAITLATAGGGSSQPNASSSALRPRASAGNGASRLYLPAGRPAVSGK